MPTVNVADLELSSSQYLSITDAAQTGLDLNSDFTIEAWIKLEQLPSTAGTNFIIASKYIDAGDQRSYLFGISSVLNKPYVIYTNNGTSSSANGMGSQMVEELTDYVGKLVHIAVTVDISSASALFYLNARQMTSNNYRQNATTIFNGTAPVTIGATGVHSAYFDGKIDEVRVWSDIRTPSEIATYYDKELVGNEANLVACWPLGNSLLDLTSNNNDLTNNNSVTFPTDYPPVGRHGIVAGL